MKMLEKMVRDYIRTQIGRDLIVNHSDTHVEEGARAAYLAGFKACREMAAKLAEDEGFEGWHQDSDPAVQIMNLGESEAHDQAADQT